MSVILDILRYIVLKCFAFYPQRFQKCEYAKTKLFRTEGRGWGLLADENIKVILLKRPAYFLFGRPINFYSIVSTYIKRFFFLLPFPIKEFSFVDNHVERKCP